MTAAHNISAEQGSGWDTRPLPAGTGSTSEALAFATPQESMAYVRGSRWEAKPALAPRFGTGIGVPVERPLWLNLADPARELTHKAAQDPSTAPLHVALCTDFGNGTPAACGCGG